ncbi:MAG: hypothetical protein MR504_07370 [Methanobrevibacter woesei]|uniref:right-handed parallel beta-helix repeat-containing protein n=1 Tax=Methanobrevibacter woesei TaxID=190976 RepID=UPI0023F1AA30|nr:Ig-like domain repeat protein [Methanobrevibacter woesei]MCI7291995.1 hypothetical protein [Methanobrevibacter woesei]
MISTKQTFIIVLMLLMFAIPAVSAEDTGDIDVTSDIGAINSIDDVATEISSDDEISLQADISTSSNFTNLQESITNAGEDDVISLTGDIIKSDDEKTSFTNGITIDKDITINGNGYTIDANNDGRIFTVAEGVTLILNNIKLINGNSDYGGAIYNSGTLNANDVTFDNNTAVYRGGAVYNLGTVIADNSKFTNNDITYRDSNNDYGGAALYNELDSISKVSNSVFADNMKDFKQQGVGSSNERDLIVGGAVANKGNAEFIGCNFTNNIGRWGGAIFNAGYDRKDNSTVLTIVDCYFESNSAIYGPGIEVQDAIFSVTDSKFVENGAAGKGDMSPNNNDGGAINAWGLTTEGNITNSVFISNSAHFGGAIDLGEARYFNIVNCTFENNTATYGGAIGASSQAGSADIVIADSTFINNVASDQGGAYQATLPTEIINSKFINNSAGNWGGAIISSSDLIVSDSTFDGNDIVNRGSGSTDYGGAAIFSNGDLKVDNSVFTNNIKNYKNGDLLTGAITSYGDVTVTNSYFANNSGRWGAAFSSADYNNQDLVTDIENCTFDNNKGLYGAGIWSWGTDFSIIDSTFTNNTAWGKGNMTPNNNNGGAINVYGATATGVISGSTFIGNEAQYGGAIDISENDGILIKDSTFTDNSATYGGAIVVSTAGAGSNNVTIVNSTFTDNSATVGGAIQNTEKLVVTDSDFINNTASISSAISNSGSMTLTGDINVESDDENPISQTDLTFTELANAIAIADGKLTLTGNVVMTESEAANYKNKGITIDKDIIIEGNGYTIDAKNLGAIFNVINRATLTLNNITLTNAIANNGAVVYATTANVNIYNSVITNNEATGFSYGIIAAIISSNVNIVNTTFSDNMNLIYQVGGTLNIDSSKFINNSGKSFSADLIFSGGADTTISNSEFVGNDGTMIFNNNGGSVIISNSTFKNHTGSEAVFNNGDQRDHGHMEIINTEFINCEDGAVYNSNAYMTIDNSSFINNSGEAIHANGEVNITNTEFINNTDRNSVYITDSANVTISNSLFVNTEIRQGKNVSFIVSDFTHLENAINVVDDELVLDSDVTMTDDEADKYKDGITINKDITIDAKGHTIDARELGRIFNIANGATLTLNNAVIINGRADQGGAIFNDGALNINNSVLINGRADQGGAIFNDGALNINNSVLINGRADLGGAIFNDGALNINNVTLKDNTALSYGGAIYSHGDVSISDSTLDGNDIVNRGTSPGSDPDFGGAAIFIYGDLKITNSNVVNNLKNYDNGDLLSAVIMTYGDVTVSSSYFANNSGRWGAAISSHSTTGDILVNIENSVFEDNQGLYGTGVLIYGSEFTITNTTFINNTAWGKGNMTPNNNNGGAIQIYGSTADGEVVDSIFIGNNAHYGGAIAISENNGVVIKNSTFINNSATVGGAIFAGTSLAGLNEVTVIGSTFINNTDSIEGAIATTEKATVSDSEFVNNGILTNAELTISGNTFTSDSKEYFILSAGAGVVNGIVLDIGVSNNVISADTAADIFVNLTDGNGNVVWEADGIKITIDGKDVTAVFNPDTNLYEAKYTTDASGIFTVSAEYNGVSDDVLIAFYKANTEITVVGNTSYEYGEDFDFTIVVDPAVNGTVTVIVSDMNFDVEENYTFTVVDGVVDYDFADFDFTPGVYTITVVYPGDSLNEFATAIFTINIEMLYTDVTIDVTDDAVYGDDVTITVTTDKNAEGVVDVIVDGETYEVPLVNGTGSVVVSGLNAGKYDIFAEYYGDMIYTPATAVSNVVVNKADSSVDVSVEDSVYGEDVILNITTSVPGYVAIIIDEKSTIAYVDGSISMELPYIAVGDHDVSVVFIGDVNYESSQANTSFTVDKAVCDVTVNIPVVGEDYVIISTIFENDATGEVTVTVNGESVTAELVNGLQVIYVPGLDAGDYLVEITYHGDENYKELTTNATFKINETLVLSAEDTTLYYKNGTTFDVSVTDDGKAVAGVEVTFTVNGAEYVRVTDSEGVAHIAINLNPGVYSITASYGGLSVVRNVTVLSTISSEDLTKYYRNDSQFYVTIVDGQGRPVEGVDVQFNINGVFYERATNSDGVARLSINLNPGEYIITVINPLNNETTSNKIVVLSTIVVEDLIKYYRNESQFHISLFDGQGNPLANTDVTININGVFYTRTTNADGVATLSINLNPGEYIATVQDPNTGLMMSALVTVLPTVTADDLVMSFQDGSSYNVTVVDKQGKPVAGVNVSMNINGIFYNRVTDENGIARLNINLNPGDYIITSYYGNATVSNKITVKQP